MDFTPKEDFFSKELGSQYCKGMGYTARPQDTKLRELVPNWVAEGKVALGRPEGAAVSGEE